VSTEALDTLVEQPAPPPAERTLLNVLAAVSFCHLINDMVQSLLPSMYPILKSSFHLDFGQLGVITLVYQVIASLLQPVIGHYTDKRPMPYSLPLGMSVTLAGLVLLAIAPSFGVILVASALVGVGSAVFHPESSRVARLASGGRHGFAQSFFQVGGNAGSAIGPLLAALIVLPQGQLGVLWFSIAAIVGITVLTRVGHWYKRRHLGPRSHAARHVAAATNLTRRQVAGALAVLIALIFSKYFYLAALTNYYTFYLMERFGVSVQDSQLRLFVFLGAVAAGTLLGGPIGDRLGRKRVIWCSILGVLPFSLLLPHASLFWTGPLTFVIGFVLASAFSAILVYGQELIPGRVGMVSGLFFGFAFGLGGIGAAVLGKLADALGIITVYGLCAWLPAIGLVTVFLPEIERAGE
jgi:FSR family fosmidomycin resistance protein-like MFS transporter